MKIFTTILARWLQKIITAYISKDQMGFIPGWTMIDNIWRTLNIIQYDKMQSFQSLMVSIDLEKAFDSIEFSCLKMLLLHMNFGKNFRSAIDMLYIQPSVKIRVKVSRHEFEFIAFSFCVRYWTSSELDMNTWHCWHYGRRQGTHKKVFLLMIWLYISHP